MGAIDAPAMSSPTVSPSLFDASKRRSRLDRPGPALVVAALGFATMLGGLIASPHPYGSIAFVVDFLVAELVLALVVVGSALAFFPVADIGLRAPRAVAPWRLLPLALLSAGAVAAWWVARAAVTDPAAADLATTGRVLRTTALVGLNEEVLFRGLLLAALWRAFGARRGAVAALVAFGVFHLLNVAGGLTPGAAAFQFVFTIVCGAVFLQAAIGSGSLWPSIVGHALYDLVVFDLGRLAAAGAGHGPGLVLFALAVLTGLVSLAMLRGLGGRGPYPR
jgi:membrane protease YdiL (CAAX protease family)